MGGQGEPALCGMIAAWLTSMCDAAWAGPCVVMFSGSCRQCRRAAWGCPPLQLGAGGSGGGRGTPRAADRRPTLPNAAGDRAHTILLFQPTPSKSSRYFNDYETVTLAMDGACACTAGLAVCAQRVWLCCAAVFAGEAAPLLCKV